MITDHACEFIADHCEELTGLAKQAGLDALAYILAMAVEEAQRQIEVRPEGSNETKSKIKTKPRLRS